MIDFLSITQICFVILVAMVAVQRLVEMRLSASHEKELKGRGAVEHARGHFIFMKILHASWLILMIAEVILLERPWIWWLAGLALLGVIAGQVLRYAAIRTLGPRWTVNIMTLPGETPVRTGIYRYVRHPNYLGVILEILFLPLFHTAYLSSIVYTLANGLILYVRIRAEEQALEGSNDYNKYFENTPRFVGVNDNRSQDP